MVRHSILTNQTSCLSQPGLCVYAFGFSFIKRLQRCEIQQRKNSWVFSAKHFARSGLDTCLLFCAGLTRSKNVSGWQNEGECQSLALPQSFITLVCKAGTVIFRNFSFFPSECERSYFAFSLRLLRLSDFDALLSVSLLLPHYFLHCAVVSNLYLLNAVSQAYAHA